MLCLLPGRRTIDRLQVRRYLSAIFPWHVFQASALAAGTATIQASYNNSTQPATLTVGGPRPTIRVTAALSYMYGGSFCEPANPTWYRDPLGRCWAPDGPYLAPGSGSYVNPDHAGAVAGATDPVPYRGYRVPLTNPSVVEYQFNVPAGTYGVTLRFIEAYFGNTLRRKFHIEINGTVVTPNFVISPILTAVDKVYTVTAGATGGIRVRLIPLMSENGELNSGTISAIEIVPQ